MNILSQLKQRFYAPLDQLVDDPTDVLGMIRPAGNPKFGDYQANCAMPLGKQLGQPPREIAQQLVDAVSLDDFVQQTEVAGPGFINVTLDDQWVSRQLVASMSDDRLGVQAESQPRTFVVDYSSPNVAKPMHVGHIRSTVIGDAIASVLQFAGHNVITDNHLGDWGTQFGMIIYGYKHFLNDAAYQATRVSELTRLYKLVRQLIDYHSGIKQAPELEQQLAAARQQAEELNQVQPTGDKKVDKKARKQAAAANEQVKKLTETLDKLHGKLATVGNDPELKALADAHPDIGNAVLLETAALHAGDETNTSLWHEFLPDCRDDMQRIYQRLNIEFDHELGESFYHPMLADVVHDLEAKGFIRHSDGAACVFLDDFSTPMIVQKKDGAFLYATTDLATIKYRMEHFQADASLYVVDHRQSEHFEKLFAVARQWGYQEAELKHVSFGTVLGKDGKPYKTREGDAEGLESLLDQAEIRAAEIARENSQDADDETVSEIARVVGIGGIKYADLSHNRTSDYVFDYDKMLNKQGNTATYLQYGYARVQGIVRKTGADIQQLRDSPQPFDFENPIERQLGVKLLQFSEAIDSVLVDYKPNLLCNYLFELGQLFAQFFDQCSVKDAGSQSLQNSRLQLCDLTARTLKTGLGLLGIEVLDKM